MIGKLNSLLKIIQGNGGTVSFTHKYLRVCCDLDTILVLGDTTLNKINQQKIPIYLHET